jgi:hypothetical protein
MPDPIRITAPFTELNDGWYRYYPPGSNEPRAVRVEMIDETMFVHFTPGLYPTKIEDVHVMGEFALIDQDGPIVKFSDLWVGDRFQRLDGNCKPAQGEVWTKLDRTGARRHGPEETRWGGKSYGYVGSASCSFELNDLVKFVPVAL